MRIAETFAGRQLVLGSATVRPKRQTWRTLRCPVCDRATDVLANDDHAQAWCPPNRHHPTKGVEMR